MSCGEAGVPTELVTSSFQFKGYAVGPWPYASDGTLRTSSEFILVTAAAMRVALKYQNAAIKKGIANEP
jgi:hypothetical protein